VVFRGACLPQKPHTPAFRARVFNFPSWHKTAWLCPDGFSRMFQVFQSPKNHGS
jgi:hypothetical protein